MASLTTLAAQREASWAWFERMQRPRTWLAPLVNYSDVAFRLLARSCGADICHTQMIDAGRAAVDPAYRASFFAPSAALAAFDRPLIAQLGGGDPQVVGAAAAAIYAEHGIDGVELNLGCPQSCAKRGGYGAFLLEDIERAAACVRAIAAATPAHAATLCKIRCFEDVEDTVAAAAALERAGAMVLTVHGRTRTMGGNRRTGRVAANWSWIAAVKSAAGCPVVANGDILSYADVLACRERTICDGVMSGVSALRTPHAVFGQGASAAKPSSSAGSGRVRDPPTQPAAVASPTSEDVAVADVDGARLLDFARRRFAFSTGRCRRALARGFLSVNGVAPDAAAGRASSMLLRRGDVVRLAASARAALDAAALSDAICGAAVVDQRGDVAVIFKPAGCRCRGAADLSLEAALPQLIGGSGWRLAYSLPRCEDGLVLATTRTALEYDRVFSLLVVGAAAAPPRFAVKSVVTGGGTTLQTLQVILDMSESFGDAVASALRAAGLVLAGARVTGGFGKGSYVALVAVVWPDDGGAQCQRIVEPPKFQKLRDTLLRRTAKKEAPPAPAPNRAAPLPRTALPPPPTSRLECAWRYLELAVDCNNIPPETVYLHLVGNLALVDQTELKARDDGRLWARLATRDAPAADLLPMFATWHAETPR